MFLGTRVGPLSSWGLEKVVVDVVDVDEGKTVVVEDKAIGVVEVSIVGKGVTYSDGIGVWTISLDSPWGLTVI